MDWSKYGEWRHPKEWWQIKLLEYMKIKHPDRLKFNPTIISVEETHIWFGMRKHYGHLRLSKSIITETIYKNNKLYSEIETAIIDWNNDGTKTAGELTRKIMEIINETSNNREQGV